jgi:phosphoenolpyruvate phosphomutase
MIIPNSSPSPARFVGSHDALTALLGERAGFQGIWVSGLEISASHGVPDDGLLPRHELIERVQEICSAVSIPVLVDVDNCCPSVNEVDECVRDVEETGAQGFVMEDKYTPKRNSFAGGEQELEPVELVCDKIIAALEARKSPDFSVFARTEALISGRSTEEALDRCLRYLECGATGVVVHSKERHPHNMLAVLGQLPSGTRVITIPTSYFDMTFEDLGRAGASIVIYANHGLRAQIAAIRSAYATILGQGSSEALEAKIATLADVFNLQGLVPAPECASDDL